MSHLPPYKYKPLKEGQMRLLSLYPGHGDEDIVIYLYRQPTSRKHYEALSYVWGAPGSPCNVTVAPYRSTVDIMQRKNTKDCLATDFATRLEICTLAVGENLFAALRQLRQPDRKRVLWIDAICIDQDNDHEKGIEVARMGDIYRRADRVVVWLGEESEDSTLAMKQLQTIGEGVSYKKWGVNFRWHVVKGSQVHKLGSNLLSDDQSVSWLAINRLLQRPYFSRLWVLQEIGRATASQAIVVLGNQKIAWKIFRGALLWIEDVAEAELSSFFSRKIIEQLLPFARSLQSLSLTQLSVMAMHTHCSDPRDRVYAILNLLAHEVASQITPDYSRSVNQVYTDAVRAEMEGMQSLNILQFCVFSDTDTDTGKASISLSTLGDPRLEHRPSWVPDLSNPVAFPTWKYLGFATCQSAQETSFNIDDGSLNVCGRMLDVISVVSTPIPHSATIQEVINVCKSLESTYVNESEYITGGSLREAFLSLLSMTYSNDILYSDGLALSREDLRTEYEALLDYQGSDTLENSRFASKVNSALQDRILFKTEKGYIGIASTTTCIGDRVCIALGSLLPLVLRRVPKIQSHYTIGGACYISGLEFGHGLVGSLPRGWTCMFVYREGNDQIEFCSLEGKKTRLDPRLGPLPNGWEIYDDQGDLYMMFRNLETGEETYNDPRLTSTHLKTLGIELEQITLV